MKVLIDIPSEEITNFETHINDYKGKVIGYGKNLALAYYTRDDAASALKHGGISDNVLAKYDREEIIDAMLRKVQDAFDADMPVDYKRFVAIGGMVAYDYNERLRLIKDLPADTEDYQRKAGLILDGVKPIDPTNDAEINLLRVELWEAVANFAQDMLDYLKNPVQEQLDKLQAGVAFIFDKEKDIDTRLFITVNVMDKNALKAILFPTVMPFEFDKERDYFFASASGLDSFKAFLDDLNKTLVSGNADLVPLIKNTVSDYLSRPFGGKAAMALKAVLKKAC